MLDFQQTAFQSAEVNVWMLLKSVDWWDPWILLLIAFHLLTTTTTFLTRNHNNFQVLMFVTLLLLVYCSENINKIASENWRLFSRQQYFDSNGFFISLVFCVPILLNCMLMVASWLYQSRELMIQLKVAQLKSRLKNVQRLSPNEDRTKSSKDKVDGRNKLKEG